MRRSPGSRPEVGDQHADRRAVDVEVDVEHGARLAAVDGQVDVPDVQHPPAGQQRVAVVAVGAQQGRAGDRVQAERGGEVLHLHRLAGLARAGVHLLQADDVGVDLAQDRRDAGRIAPAVAAHAFVDVVRGDAQPAGRRPSSAASRSGA